MSNISSSISLPLSCLSTPKVKKKNPQIYFLWAQRLSINHSKICTLSITEIPSGESVRWHCRPSAVVVPTGSECVRGVDLAVRRRIKWLIGGARRGEGVRRLALLPLSRLLCLSLARSPSLRQEKRPLGLNKQITWPSNTTHHHCTGTSFRQRFTGLCSALIPTSKDAHTHTHRLNTHTHTHTHACKHAHCWVSPSTWQWFYKSPQCEVS